MKTSKTFVVIGILLLLGLGIFMWSSKGSDSQSGEYASQTAEEILGCYVSRTGNDVYTMNLAEGSGTTISGRLDFRNFQKDSSSGEFEGNYENGILWGNYSFQSEGMDSVMQVIFKRTDEGFVRGYGPLDESGTVFTNPDEITYDASSSLNVFKAEPCAETYNNSDLGIEFKYGVGEEGYVLTEKDFTPDTSNSNLLKLLVLRPKGDETTPEGGEQPASITINVFRNLNNLAPLAWASANTSYSVFNLKTAESDPFTVDGEPGIRYPADGLYASDNVVVAFRDKIYVISGGYIDENSPTRRDYIPLVRSVQFLRN